MRFTSSSNTLLHCCMQHTASSSNVTWYVHTRTRTCIRTAVHIYFPCLRKKLLHTRSTYVIVCKYLHAQSIIQQEQQHTAVITTCVPPASSCNTAVCRCRCIIRRVYMHMRIHDKHFNIHTYVRYVLSLEYVGFIKNLALS